MASDPGISVVIPALNAAGTIGEQLDAVLGQRCPVPFEVVVADNGSDDGTVDLVRRRSSRDDRVRLVDASSRPLGGAAAKNLGVERARADLIAFCDADDVVAEGWLDALVEGLQEHPLVLAVREYWELNPGVPRSLVPRYGSLATYKTVPTLSGGAFGIQRSLYLEVDGFDELFAGSVDTEFGMRLYATTGTAGVVADGAVVHCRLPDGARQWCRRHRLLARSRPTLDAMVASIDDRPSVGRSNRLRRTAWLAVRPHYLLSRPRRLVWAKVFGALVGEVEASVFPSRGAQRREPAPSSGL